jgi:hypothetical protein
MTNKVSLRDLVDALRSGKYPKGVGALRAKKAGETEFSFCCEGVMCELNGVPQVSVHMDDFGGWYTKYYDETLPSTPATSFAPQNVWVGTGMRTATGVTAQIKLPSYYKNEDTGELESDGWEYLSLAALNDYTPAHPKNAFTFDQIADLIEWAYLSD